QAIGSDGTFFGQGNTPAMYLFKFSTENYYELVATGSKVVHIGNNPSSHTVADFSNDLLNYNSNTNVQIIKYLSLSTNLPPSPMSGAGTFWSSNYDLYWVTPTKTNLVTLGH